MSGATPSSVSGYSCRPGSEEGWAVGTARCMAAVAPLACAAVHAVPTTDPSSVA